MRLCTLPIPLGSVSDDEELIIDMSSPSFPSAPELQIRSSIVFIRNINLHATFDFSKCSYEVKSAYLLMYMTEYFRVNIPELTTTWVTIISHKYGRVDCESILTGDEVIRFISENKDLVNELIIITGSIPIYAIMCFMKLNGESDIMPSDIEISSYDKINGWNYFNMLDVDAFIRVIQLIDDVIPKYYSNYFVVGNDIAAKTINRLPYVGLLSIMMSDDDSIREKFIEVLDSV